MYKPKDITVRKAAAAGELEAIYRLRYKAYLEKGYISENPSKVMSDEWDELAETTHFVALQKGKIVGAVRLVPDSVTGLPMERVFPEEISLMRTRGRIIAEASTLVVDDNCSSYESKLWIKLCKAVWQEAEALTIDDLCIAVTESHLDFYRRLLFETISSPKQYKSLNGILAYPLHVEIRQVRKRDKSQGGTGDRSLRRHFLAEP
jgi:N-acyl-L-homoserine lactone synthetase